MPTITHTTDPTPSIPVNDPPFGRSLSVINVEVDPKDLLTGAVLTAQQIIQTRNAIEQAQKISDPEQRDNALSQLWRIEPGSDYTNFQDRLVTDQAGNAYIFLNVDPATFNPDPQSPGREVVCAANFCTGNVDGTTAALIDRLYEFRRDKTLNPAARGTYVGTDANTKAITNPFYGYQIVGFNDGAVALFKPARLTVKDNHILKADTDNDGNDETILVNNTQSNFGQQWAMVIDDQDPKFENGLPRRRESTHMFGRNGEVYDIYHRPIPAGITPESDDHKRAILGTEVGRVVNRFEDINDDDKPDHLTIQYTTKNGVQTEVGRITRIAR